jgi:hypothetical protein
VSLIRAQVLRTFRSHFCASFARAVRSLQAIGPGPCPLETCLACAVRLAEKDDAVLGQVNSANPCSVSFLSARCLRPVAAGCRGHFLSIPMCKQARHLSSALTRLSPARFCKTAPLVVSTPSSPTEPRGANGGFRAFSRIAVTTGCRQHYCRDPLRCLHRASPERGIRVCAGSNSCAESQRRGALECVHRPPICRQEW